LKTVYYDAQNDRLAHLDSQSDWTPDDVRLYVFGLQFEKGFDSFDWLLAWDDQDNSPNRWRSVFFLGGDMPQGVTSQRLDALFDRAFAQ